MTLSLREALQSKRLLGYWSVIPCPQIHEILSGAGYSFAIIDLEHGTYSFQDALISICAIKESGMYALIRPSSHDPKEILRCLELGVDGICIPQVQSVEQAKKVIDACYYPPKGSRGASGFTRASAYGSVEFKEHVDHQNTNLFVMLLIEDIAGISNIDAISSIPGVGGIYFGTYDLASSLGVGDDQNSTRVIDIVSQSMETVTQYGLVGGQVSVSNDQFKSLDSRINFVAAGVDCGIISSGSRNFIENLKK